MNIMRRIFNTTCLLTLAALVLVACGSFAFQGEAQPSGDGGITITGDTQVLPEGSSQSESGSPILGQNAMLILFVLIGVGGLILVLVLMIGRSSGHNHT